MNLCKVKVHSHFKLYKPYGYLSQFESNAKHQRNSKFLGELFEFPKGIMAIGRLDKDSEGLLLLTTDGQVSFDVSAKHVEKEYYAQVDGIISESALLHLQQGVEISIEGTTYHTKPCLAKRIESPNLPERAKRIRNSRHGETSWVSIIITEGKFRQVRKMTSAVGFPTLRLVRVRVGNNHLDTMQPLEVIEVDSFFK
ncbi:MAG: pseudouridine synthase [Aquaticitalea sp.]